MLRSHTFHPGGVNLTAGVYLKIFPKIHDKHAAAIQAKLPRTRLRRRSTTISRAQDWGMGVVRA